MSDDPRPLAPGEKMGLLLKRDFGVEVFEHQELQQRIYELSSMRYDFRRLNETVIASGIFTCNLDEDHSEADEAPVENESPEDALGLAEEQKERVIRMERTLAATAALSLMGGTREDVDTRMTAVTGKGPLVGVASAGPPSRLSKVRRNLAD